MTIAGSLGYSTELDTTGLKRGLRETENMATKSGSTLKSMFTALQLDKVVSAAMSVVSNSIDGAVSRLDTLNNYPKVMSNLGIAATDSTKSIQKMSDKLTGLPTALDAGALAVQRFTSKNNDVLKSTDIFLALNNAILAGGASAEIQSAALEQMAQAYAKGKPDLMEWRSLMTAMPAQLKQVAIAMKYASADDLYEAIKDGNVTMDEFMDTIIKLNTEGVGNFKSFEEQARNSTNGVNTSITNMKTQVVKGLTEVFDQVDKGLAANGFGGLADVIANIGVVAREGLKTAAKYISPVIKGIKDLMSITKKLSPVIKTVAIAWIGWAVGNKIISLTNTIKKNMSATVLLQKATDKLTGSKSKEAVASAKQTLAHQKNTTTLRQATVAQNSHNTATKLGTALGQSFSAVWKANPFGVIVTGLSVVVPLIMKFAEWVDKSNKSANEGRLAYDNLASSQKKLSEKIEENQQTRQNSVQTTEAEAYAAEVLFKQIEELSGVEDKSNYQKEKMASLVEKLNEIMPGLNVEYDKEKDSLNQSVQAIRDKIKAQQDLMLANAYEENMLEVARDIAKQKKLEVEAEEKLKKAREDLANATKKLKEFEKKHGTDSLNMTKEQQAEYARLQGEVGKYQGNVEKSNKALKDSQDKIAALNGEMNTYKNLSDKAFDSAQIEESLNRLVEQAEKKGIEVPKRVSSGIKEGSYALPETIDQLNQLIQFDKALQVTGVKANEIPLSLSEGILNGSILVQDAVAQANNWVDFQEALDKANLQGAEIPEALQTKILNGSISVEEAVDQLLGKVDSSAKKNKQKIKDSAEDVAKNGFMEGWKIGLGNKQSKKDIEDAASNIGKTCKVKLKKSINSNSPSKDTQKIGGYFLDGFKIGIQDRNKQNSLFSAISDFGSGLLGSLRNKLKIHSPSEETEQDGIYFLEGFGLGIKNQTNSVLKRVSNLGTNITDTFKNSIDTTKVLDTIGKLDNQLVENMSRAVSLETGSINGEASLKANYICNNVIQIENQFKGDVEIDGRKAGQVITPYITKTIKVGGGK